MRAALPHHPRAARRHRRAALLPALLHQPPAAGLVRAHSQGRPALPPLRPLQLLLHAGAAQLSLPDRAQPRLAHPGHSSGPPVSSCFAAALRPHRLANLRRNRRHSRPKPPRTHLARRCRPTWAARLLWLGLAASASILLLAVTTHLTQDVAAIPFLWIVPARRLSAELHHLLRIAAALSPRRLRSAADRLPRLHGLPPLAGSREDGPCALVIALFRLALFVCCMVCHGELVRLKPHPRYLTGFYVIVSLGGAMGGLFVGLLAPNVFHAYYEFPIGLALCALVTAIVFARALWSAPRIWKQTGICRDGRPPGRLRLLPPRHHVPDGGRLPGGGPQFLRPAARGR